MTEPRGRGRPPGRTHKGDATRQHLYEVAIAQFAAHGYEAATLREIAKAAGVSPGLLYRYFPNKGAVVLALYDELSAEYAGHVRSMPSGPWEERAWFALETSLSVLGRHRTALSALVSVLVGSREDGLFAERTAFSRHRVQPVFVEAVTGALHSPEAPVAAALGRLLYLAHLAVVLWWLLDRSPDQRATAGLLALLRRLLPVMALGLLLPGVAELILSADALARDGLLGDAA